MSTVKTTVSLQKSLFDAAESLAEEMGIARSQLFAMALEEFVRREDTRKLIQQANAAYEYEPDQEDQQGLDQMLRAHREILDEWEM
jgi:metal-responsive CopG/Arc/MetJ family transcriptional regulator